MKLYTEEQVKEIINKAKIPSAFGGFFYTNTQLIDSLTPIELPSDEEIGHATRTKSLHDCSYETNFKLGAKWMKEQILNQNK